jgi:hypothetical protein
MTAPMTASMTTPVTTPVTAPLTTMMIPSVRRVIAMTLIRPMPGAMIPESYCRIEQSLKESHLSLHSRLNCVSPKTAG